MSRFIEFSENKVDDYTGVYNKKTGCSLGIIKFNRKWNKCCFYPEDNTFFDFECMKSILKYLEKLGIKDG